jgi:lysine-N-methylase
MSIPLQPEDRRRIEQQNWTKADGVEPAKIIVSGLNSVRLGHLDDGSCVFLDPKGRCRIHTKFGEAAKPLACRLFPIVIHPAGKKLLLGLRFSCPSAAENKGRPLAEQGTEALKLAKIFLPENCEKNPPPPVATEAGLDWPDFLRFVHHLDQTLAVEQVSIGIKLLRGLHLLGAVERGALDGIQGESAEEILTALAENAVSKAPSIPEVVPEPSAFGRLFLRLMVLENARTVTVADADIRSAHRWKMLAAAFRFARSTGCTPALRAELKAVKFADIEKDFHALTPAMEALLTRYFRVKIQSLQFCGKAFFDRPLIEGFRNLVLLYPVIMWLARWLAVSDGRMQLVETDMLRAVSLVDHQYSFTPYLKWRTRLLHQRNDIVKLCAWYAR